MKTVLLMLAAALYAPAAAWTDRTEYDLVLTIRAEATPQKRLALLDQWKAKYPQSELRQVRRELYLAAYQELSDSVHMLDVAKEMIADQTGNLVGAYWCTVLIPISKTATPELWALGEKAAKQLLIAPRPAGIPDAEWVKQKEAADLLAHRALAWIAWQRGDFAAAEPEFQSYLKKNPNNGEMTEWYGLAIASQKKNDLMPLALWQLARAGALKDEQALPDVPRRQVNELVDRMYASYHGSAEGLEQVRTAAAAESMPGADFKIESAEFIAARKAEEELQRTNPMLFAWNTIRKQLTGPDADKYFTETLHPAPLPRMKGTVIRCSPEKAPTEVVLGMSNAVTEEVVLKLATPMPNSAAPGTELEFEGLADSFTKSPLQLGVAVATDKVTGWPALPVGTKRK